MKARAKLGAYEVVAKLGEGGMGEVYRATDVNLKRQVARSGRLFEGRHLSRRYNGAG